MRTALTLLVAMLMVVNTALLVVPVYAQQISAPLVREPATPQTSATEDTRALMGAAPMRVWQEGDPVHVKGDLKERNERGAAPLVRPRKQRDPLLRQVQPRRAAAPSLAPTIGATFDGIAATGVLPPDPVGAVGPSHYIQMVNSACAI